MRVRGFFMFGLTLSVAGAAALGVATFVGACDDEHRRSEPSEGGAVGACSANPGEFPAANCDPSSNSCTPTPGCTIDNGKCGASTCLPMANNTGSVLDFRFRRLNIIAPPSLTFAVNPTLQTAIINSAVDLNAKSCAEVGKGTFSWLLRVDKNAKTITTGGAPPPTDPFGAGYCFYNHTVTVGDAGAPINVQPVTVPFTNTGDTYQTSAIDKLYVPIFLDEKGTSVIILPLSKPILKDVTITENGNCIGSLNTDALAKDCTDSFSDCSKWRTAGSLGGFITLEDADTVAIRELNQTLCVVLTQTAPANKCARDGTGKITAKGDFCSTSNKAGDCADSFWLASTFAAAAVKINDGSTTPTCQAGTTTDAGPDTGPTDSGSDAPVDAPTDAPDGGG
jgi:hypothetical protein